MADSMVLNKINNVRNAVKKCKSLRSKVLKDGYDQILKEIVGSYKNFKSKSNFDELRGFLNKISGLCELFIKKYDEKYSGEKPVSKNILSNNSYTKKLNEDRKKALRELSNACKECTEALEDMEKAQEEKKEKSMLGCVRDGIGYVIDAFGGSNELVGNCKDSTPQNKGFKQRCNVESVFDINAGTDILSLLRCYICVEVNLGGKVAGNAWAHDFDFKNYAFGDKSNYTDPEFNKRKIYKAKKVEIKIAGLGNVILHIFISPNPTKVGGIVKNYIDTNNVLVDEEKIELANIVDVLDRELKL